MVARTANESFAAAGAERTRKGAVSFEAGTDRPGPIGIMVVAETPNPIAGGRSRKIVVLGDADVASDGYLPLLGNKDLLVNTFGWLSAEAATGARPRDPVDRLGPVSPVYVSDRHSRVILLVTVVLQPLLFLTIGSVVSLRRRRRV